MKAEQIISLAERKDLLRQIIPQIAVATVSDKTNRKGSIMWMDWFTKHPEHARKLGYEPGAKGHGSGTPWAANNVLASALIRKEGIRPKGRLPGSRYEKRPYKKGLTLRPYQNGTREPHIPGFATEAPEVQQGVAELQEQAYQEVKAEVKSLREEIRGHQATVDRLRAELIEAKDVTFELLIQLQRAKVQIMELKKG